MKCGLGGFPAARSTTINGINRPHSGAEAFQASCRLTTTNGRMPVQQLHQEAKSYEQITFRFHVVPLWDTLNQQRLFKIYKNYYEYHYRSHFP